MKKISLLILIFIFGIVEVNAYSVTKKGFGITEACDYPIISNTASCDASSTYHVGNGETFFIDYNGQTLNAYCIDPGAHGPANVTERDSSLIAEHLEPLKYICEKTEGNEVLRQALIKAYSVQNTLGETKYADDPSGTNTAYKSLGDKTKFNSKYDTNGNALTILNEANKRKGTSKTDGEEPVFSSSSGVLTLKTPVKGKIIITGDGKYNVLINSVKQTSSTSITYEVKDVSIPYTIKMTEPDCDVDKVVSATVSFEYKKDDLPGTSSSKYNVRYFANENIDNVQRLITCEPTGAGENPNCVGNDCKINNTISANCVAETCKEPEFVDGSGICNSAGTTVVTIKEEPNTLDYAGTKCITKLPNATEAILGTTNDYCNIYCSENYSLNLPGPDAKVNGDKEVFINAGSYFTIDDSEMKETNTITCYGKMNIDSYKKTLHDARGLVVKAYNDLSYLKGYKEALKNAKMTDTGCQVTGSYRELYFDGDQIKDRTTSFPAGKDLPKCPVDNVSQSEIDNLTKTLNDQIKKAEEIIKEASTKWNQCISWSFDDLNELLNKEDCSSEIDFVYQFDQCDAKVVKDGDLQKVSETEKKSTETNPNLYTGICDVSGNLSNCNKTTNNTAYTYINRQETVVQKYKFDNAFTVHFETGEINCDAKTGDEYSDVYYGFPVSIDASQAKYKYEYKYTGIGHKFDLMSKDVCSMGRFDSIIKDNNSHSCYYDVNSCGDCDVYCDDTNGNCDLPLCDGECQVACVGGGCILDFNAGFLATYRTLSLNNPFPNTVAMLSATPSSLLAVASTKDYETSYETNWTTEKGLASTEKIKVTGEDVYNKKPQYSIELNPTVISEIRKYNAKQEDNEKGYLNSDIKCIDGTNDNYGQCISTFVHKTDEKWKFEIQNDLGNGTINVGGTPMNYTTEIIDIDGIKAPFIVYPNAKKSFVGPAWK